MKTLLQPSHSEEKTSAEGYKAEFWNDCQKYLKKNLSKNFSTVV